MINGRAWIAGLLKKPRRDPEYPGPRAEPKIAIRPLRDGVDMEMGEGRPSEMLAVEARQAGEGGNPKGPVPCLQDVVDDIRSKSIFSSKGGSAIAARRRSGIKGEPRVGGRRQERQGGREFQSASNMHSANPRRSYRAARRLFNCRAGPHHGVGRAIGPQPPTRRLSLMSDEPAEAD